MKNLTYCLLAGLCLHAAVLQAARPHGTTETTTTLAESVKRVVFGQPITLTAVVSPASATGSVTFYADSTDFLGIATISGGRARLTTQLLSTGSHALSAYYAGNATYAPSTSAKVVGTVVALPESGLQAAASYTVGNDPYALALADFNGDGKMDIVAACANFSGFSTISILLGNGDGTFANALNSFTTPAGAQAVVTGDFNGDGKVDIALDNGTGAYAPAVSVLLGNGDGTFQAPITYPLGSYLEGITAADINGDGIDDLVVSNNANGTSLGDVEVLLGNGDGTFQTPIVLTADFSPLYAVVADFNGDGKADIAVPNYSSSDISVLLGNGDGTFQSAVNYSSGGPQPLTIAVADFNGDGKLDIATANAYGYNAGVLLGYGDGTFQAAVTYPINGVGRPEGIAGGDINGDGVQDLVVTSDNAANVLLGNGDGTFQPTHSYDVIANMAFTVALGDFNSDGRTDVAFTDFGSNTVGILLGLPLPATTSIALTAAPNPSTYLQTVTLTGNVFPPLATGRISFYDTSTLLGSSPITAGKATLPISNLAPGTHTLRAVYDGDANDLTSKSAPVSLTVNKIATTSTLSSTPNPSTYGQTVTFTAQVTPSGATGTVTFYDSSAVLGSAPLSGGLAALSTSTLSPGAHTITAVYSGDNDFAPSTSAALTQNVKRVATATALTAAPNPSRVGQNVKLTASVSPASATGSVTFYDGTTAIASRTLSAGAAVFNTTALTAGTHPLKAVYSGDADNAPSTSLVVSQVVQ